MHGTSGYISAFESSKTRKIDDAIISPKSIQRRFQFISQFVSVPRASLPMITGVDSLHQIAPNHSSRISPQPSYSTCLVSFKRVSRFVATATLKFVQDCIYSNCTCHLFSAAV
jgi:hypothetical protein